MIDAYLLDTNIASIAWDGGHKRHSVVREALASLADESIWICAVSIGEVEYGLGISPNIDPERHRAVRDAMGQYRSWHIDEETARIWARLRGELFRRYAPKDQRGRVTRKHPEDLCDDTTAKQLGIQENDLWIVSVAIQYNLRFLTTDRMERILEVARKVEGYDRAVSWSLDDPPAALGATVPPSEG